jgi:hypothetical protein
LTCKAGRKLLRVGATSTNLIQPQIHKD